MDLALYEPIFRILDELVPAYQKLGFVRERMGAETDHACPHGHYQARDGHWVALACSSDLMFDRLAKAMGRPDLSAPDRFGKKHQRLKQREEVNKIVSAWVSSLDSTDIVKICDDVGVAAGVVYSIANIFADPQYRARENIKTTESRVGALAVPNVVPKLSRDTGSIEWLGQALGSHNEQVYGGLLGLKPEDIETLHAQGVI